MWRVPRDGGPATPVTRVKDGVGLFDLARDAAALYYTTTEESVDKEWDDLRKKFKDLKYGHGVTDYSRVWKLDLVAWRTKKLVDEKRVISAMSVSPDQRRIAMITTPDEELIAHEGHSRVEVFDTVTEKVTIVTGDGWRSDHPSPFGWLDTVTWSSDSAAIAFAVSFDGYPTKVYVADGWDGNLSHRELTRPDGVFVNGPSLRWRDGSHDVCFIGDERARARVFAIRDVHDGKQGASQTLTSGDVVVSAFDFGPSGDPLAIVMGTTEHTPDLFLASTSGGYQRLTNINPQVDTWKLPRLSIVSWEGADGAAVEGILELPPDHKPGTPLPMIVEIHGGPTASTHYALRYWIYGRTLLAANGYAVLSPNYRGSTGYGDQFLIDLIGRENDVEVTDILRGVDAMVQRGIADPDKLGVMGWSNGGFLTNCLITTSDRFKAASSGAGVLDQVIQWGIEDTPGHVINYMQGLPWAVTDKYRAGSPLYNLHKVRTPTLIHVGEHDQRVPAAHARTLYRALRHYLKVPVELIVYPDEGHGLTTYQHRKAKMKWDLAWFARYPLGDSAEKEPQAGNDHNDESGT